MGLGVKGWCSGEDREQVVTLGYRWGHKEGGFLDGPEMVLGGGRVREGAGLG